jgi:hypothetical protein
MLLLSAKGLIHLKLGGSSKCQEIIWTSGGEIYQKTICFGMTGHWMQACSRGKEISCKGLGMIPLQTAMGIAKRTEDVGERA